jgi:hypothetical protein
LKTLNKILHVQAIKTMLLDLSWGLRSWLLYKRFVNNFSGHSIRSLYRGLLLSVFEEIVTVGEVLHK